MLMNISLLAYFWDVGYCMIEMQLGAWNISSINGSSIWETPPNILLLHITHKFKKASVV